MRALALPLLLMAAPAHAGGQFWLDAYGGKALEETATLSLNQDLLFGPDSIEYARFDPQLESLAGLRLRGEIDPVPVGVGLDLGYAQLRQPQADLNLVPVAMGVTLPSRLTLARSARMGSLHPIGMLGIVATAVDGRARMGSIDSEVNDNTWSGGNGRIGLHASLGLSWQPSPGFAVFTEYRYQQLRFHLEHTNEVILATQYLETTGRITSQSVLVGVSFRLGQVADANATRQPADPRDPAVATPDSTALPAAAENAAGTGDATTPAPAPLLNP